MSNFSKVGTFMKTFGQEVKDKPAFSTDKINKLRIDLIKEELEELTEAMKNNDLVEVADALTDILYVTYGAGHAFGINLDKCFDEVQNSNMSKLDENGEHDIRLNLSVEEDAPGRTAVAAEVEVAALPVPPLRLVLGLC